MNTNIKKTIVALLIATVTLTSCEEWLDESSSAVIIADEQFEVESGFKDALLGVYIGMTSQELYAKDLTWNAIDLLSQQYAPLPSGAQYAQIQQYRYKTTSSIRQIDAIWKKLYNTIANINSELSQLEAKKEVLSSINYAIIKGELLGLRAFLHFDLIRIYGHSNMGGRSGELASKFAIPYVKNYSSELHPQLTYTATFNELGNDIKEALELLKEDPIYPNATRSSDYFLDANREGFYDNREQRMNYFAVKALQARMLLWQGGTENINAAKLAAEEVIATSGAYLIVSATYNVSSDPILWPEVLFSLNVYAFEDIVNRFLDADRTTNYDALFMAASTAAEVFETANPNIGIADVRYSTLLTTQTKGLVSIKLMQGDNNLHRNQMPLIKLPEMYYIVAEASIDTDLPKAIEYLNLVRASRGILDPIDSASDVEIVKSEITKEYRKEFISEGQLFFYFKRTGVTTIPGLSEETVVDDEIYMLPYPASEIQFGYVQ